MKTTFGHVAKDRREALMFRSLTPLPGGIEDSAEGLRKDARGGDQLDEFVQIEDCEIQIEREEGDERFASLDDAQERLSRWEGTGMVHSCPHTPPLPSLSAASKI